MIFVVVCGNVCVDVMVIGGGYIYYYNYYYDYGYGWFKLCVVCDLEKWYKM